MQALSLLQYDILKDVPHCFTTRLGGVSEGGQTSLNLSFSREPSRKNVLENYRRVSEALGVAFERMTHVPQRHGDHVLVVTEKEAGSGITKPYPDGAEAYGYDAMITDVPGTVLCTLHADCVPVLLYDTQNNAVGAVHSGWRGTVLKIAAKTVRKMECVYGTLPSKLRAVIGPSIGMDCFETDDDVYEALRESFGLYPEGDLFYRKGKKYHISVSGFVYRTLLEAGLLAQNIFYDTRCTFADEKLFFSHRRDRGDTGAMAAVISVRSGSV